MNENEQIQGVIRFPQDCSYCFQLHTAPVVPYIKCPWFNKESRCGVIQWHVPSVFTSHKRILLFTYGNACLIKYL